MTSNGMECLKIKSKHLYRDSDMRGHFVWNLFNKMWKMIWCKALQSILSFLEKSLINNTKRPQMLESIYHTTTRTTKMCQAAPYICPMKRWTSLLYANIWRDVTMMLCYTWLILILCNRFVIWWSHKLCDKNLFKFTNIKPSFYKEQL